MVILLKIKRRDFSNETAFLFWCHSLWKLASSNCCIFEMKHVTGMETCTEIYFFFYLQPSEIRIRKVRYFDFIIWWRHCENHLYLLCQIYTAVTRWPRLKRTTSRVVRTSWTSSRPRAPLVYPLSHFLGLYPSYSGLPIKSWSTLITLSTSIHLFDIWVRR